MAATEDALTAMSFSPDHSCRPIARPCALEMKLDTIRVVSRVRRDSAEVASAGNTVTAKRPRMMITTNSSTSVIPARRLGRG